jgi:predicted GIY-YIG superfamily endonuclease
MFIVCVLRSLKDLKLYIGMTQDLATRVETCRREKYLKSGPGHAFILSVISPLA